jgi:hypothetical protein
MATPSSAPSIAKEQFILRLPFGMRDHLKHLAAANRRSMNAELLLLIERGMGLSSSALPDGAIMHSVEGAGQNMA